MSTVSANFEDHVLSLAQHLAYKMDLTISRKRPLEKPDDDDNYNISNLLGGGDPSFPLPCMKP